MAKKMNDLMADAALDYLAGATVMLVCTSEPADRAAALAAALADVALTGGDFTKANGDTSGRKVTIAQKSNVPIDANGTGTHVALIDGSTLRYVTTCASQVLNAGGTVTFPAWDVEIADPV